ncbi:hypothetical protein V8G54_016010 [Vigna mungo]|uniref:Uncharacterized protein n=1 Tax=Vigna mungo TaxID=3915 RepID=A0AAQ3NKD5_VIGMU
MALALSVSGLKSWKACSSSPASNNSTSPFHPLSFMVSWYKIFLSLNSSFPVMVIRILEHASVAKEGAPATQGLIQGLSIPPGASGHAKLHTFMAKLCSCPSTGSDPIGFEPQKKGELSTAPNILRSPGRDSSPARRSKLCAMLAPLVSPPT